MGNRGPRDAKEREKDSSEEEFTERRGSCAGPTGTAWREQKSKEEGRRQKGGKSRILTERWGMSRRVVCSHGSSLSTAVQYAGQGKVTLLCVRARARARLFAVPYTIARIHTYTSLYSRSLAVTLS